MRQPAPGHAEAPAWEPRAEATCSGALGPGRPVAAGTLRAILAATGRPRAGRCWARCVRSRGSKNHYAGQRHPACGRTAVCTPQPPSPPVQPKQSRARSSSQPGRGEGRRPTGPTLASSGCGPPAGQRPDAVRPGRGPLSLEGLTWFPSDTLVYGHTPRTRPISSIRYSGFR